MACLRHRYLKMGALSRFASGGLMRKILFRRSAGCCPVTNVDLISPQAILQTRLDCRAPNTCSMGQLSQESRNTLQQERLHQRALVRLPVSLRKKFFVDCKPTAPEFCGSFHHLRGIAAAYSLQRRKHKSVGGVGFRILGVVSESRITCESNSRRGKSLAVVAERVLDMFKLREFAIGVVVFLLSAPAALYGQAVRSVDTANNTSLSSGSEAQQPADPNRPVLEHRNPRYRLNRDDVMLISFPLSPELAQTVTVQPDGFISLQNAGSVYIQGLTVPETVEAIKKAYSTTLNNPIVDVDLIDFQKPFFIVSGQVNKPGQYDLRYDITVTQAIAIAGGFAPTAKTQIFLFRRVSPDLMEVKKLRLNDILNGKNVNEDSHMSPGDTIFVPEKAITKFRKYVPYSIGTSFSPSSAFM
jgi:polysaccharide export outer membrane protein